MKGGTLPPLAWDSPVGELSGIGPAIAGKLDRLGIRCLADLLWTPPRAWRDLAHLTPVARCVPGKEAAVRVRFSRARVSWPGRGRIRSLVEATFRDGAAALKAVWFNAPYRARGFAPGADCLLVGTIIPGRGRVPVPVMENPEIERIEDLDVPRAPSAGAGRLVPVYRGTEGVSQKRLRRAVWEALGRLPDDACPDWIPAATARALRLRPLRSALEAFHFPVSSADATAARRELAFSEAFLFRAVLLCGDGTLPGRARPIVVDPGIDRRIRARLPFRLTPGQDRAIAEIAADLARDVPMRRLLQGDVGSGKTAVAAWACLASIARGFPAAVIAPTQILAGQHAARFRSILSGARVEVRIVTGGRGETEGFPEGRPLIAVGTHALLDRTEFLSRCGVAVVDEQHRFGVRARAAAAAEGGGPRPHLLAMTATPIPRSLSLTLYGGLSRTVLAGMPPGRRPVRTVVVAAGERRRAFDAIVARVRAGARAYVVSPLIGAPGPGGEDPRGVVALHRKLSTGAFRSVPVGILHGRMAPEARSRSLADFASGATRVLVATTLVEVGIDIPEASLLVVVDADRFGLTQLHQLRGRVGRGHDPGSCFLFTREAAPAAEERLAAFARCRDGFEVAELDLATRGPGEWFGTEQSGVPGFFRILDLASGAGALERAAREAARARPGPWREAAGREAARRLPGGTRWIGAL